MSAEQKKGISAGFKIAIATVVIIGLSVGGYFIWDYTKSKPVTPPDGKKPDEDKSPAESASQSTTGSGYTSSSSNTGFEQSSAFTGGNSFPLKKGSSGSNVVRLQRALNKFYAKATNFAPLDDDGKFGNQTEAAVKRVYGQTKKTVVEGDIDYLNKHVYQKK